MKGEICVIGGGAAGMVAAIAAASQGSRICIFEKKNRLGKKLLMTGNGRCNYTNVCLDLKKYYGKPYFIKAILEKFNAKDTIEFFQKLGIYQREESKGKIFPYSGQASAVLDVLRMELERLKVEIYEEKQALEIKPQVGGGFRVFFENDFEDFQNIVVATGGKSYPQTGSDGCGYELLQKLGHSLVKPFPSLVQLILKKDYFFQIQGVKFEGKASLRIDEKIKMQEEGEILFTNYGISGPPILQLSRQAGAGLQKGKKVWVDLDLVPELTCQELQGLLQQRFDLLRRKDMFSALIGFINKRLIRVILKEAFLKPDLLAGEMKIKDIIGLAKLLKKWSFEVKKTKSWDTAQVTAGGIDVTEVDPENMSSYLHPGLYLAGEILNVDALCGGFNLQWAWATGMIAGRSAGIVQSGEKKEL